MSVSIENGGLAFRTDLDSSGFAQGANKLISKEAEIRQAVADGAKQQKFYSDEMLRAASNSNYAAETKVKAAIKATEANKIEGLSIRSLNEELKKQQLLAQNTGDPKQLLKYNQIIQESQGEIKRLSSAGKSGFDDLGNVVAETSKKTGGFVSGLGTAFGAVRKLAYILPGVGVAGLIGFFSGPIIEYISNLDLFTDKSKGAVEAQRDLAKEMGKAGEAAGKATIEIDLQKQAFDQARKGVITKTEALKQYNDKIGKTLGFTNDINIAEERTIKNGDAYIELMFKKAKAAALLTLYQEQIAEQAKIQAKSSEDAGSFILSGTKDKSPALDKLYQKNAQKNRDTEKAPFIEKADVFKKLILDTDNDIRNFAKKNGLSVDDLVKPPKGKSDDTYLKETLSLKQKISDISNEYARKSLSKDEAEIQAVRDKFKKISSEVERFNANPKNKYKVDGNGLKGISEAAINDLQYKQNTAKFGIELEEQKKIYSAYESFKTTFGEAKANERFAKELEIAKATADKEAKELAGLLTKQAVGGGLNNNQQERFNLLTKDLKAQSELKQAQQDKDLAQALKASETYEVEKKAIEDKYNSLKLALPADKEYIARSNELDTALKLETDKLNETQFQKIKAVKAFYDGVDAMSTKSARTVIANAKIELEASNLTAAAKAKILKSLDSASKAVEERLPKKLADLAGELGKVANAVKPIDANFADILGTVANVIGSVGQIKSLLSDLKTAQGKGDLLGSLTSGLGIAGSLFSAVNSITAIINKKDQENAKAKQDQIEYSNQLQIKAIEAQTKAMERQLALIKDIYGAERIAKYGQSIATLDNKIADSLKSVQGKLLLVGNKSDDAIVDATNNTSKKLDQAIRDELIKKGYLKELNIDLSKGADEIERLQALLDSGKFDQTTAANVQALITYVKQYKDTLNALKAETIGSTFEEIGNSIVEMFAKGTASAEDFGKNFEEIIKKSILQTFKGDVLNKALQDYYDKFAEYSKSGGGLDSGEIAALRLQYNEIIANSKKQFDDLQKATGIDFGAGAASSQNGLSKGIQGITETTANRLEGEFGGLRLAQLQLLNQNTTNHFQIMQANTNKISLLIAIQANTGRTADNTEELKVIRTSLENIDKKTADVGALLRGAGIKI